MDYEAVEAATDYDTSGKDDATLIDEEAPEVSGGVCAVPMRSNFTVITKCYNPYILPL